MRALVGLAIGAVAYLAAGAAAAETKVTRKPVKKSRKAAAGQKEMLMSIVGKKPEAKKPAARPQRKSA